MSDTYSTRHRDMEHGRIYSSRGGHATVLTTGKVPLAPQPQVQVQPEVQPQVQVPPPPPPPTPMQLQAQPHVQPPVQPDLAQEFRYRFSSEGIPGATRFGQIGGTAVVSGCSGGKHQVTASLSGLGTLPDPSVKPVLWLVADLSVPADLDPRDLAALPTGRSGMGNRPGEVFTVDGNPPTYTPVPNTVTAAVSPGAFTLQPGGGWTLATDLDSATNRVFHPLVVLGPTALSDINASLPSGTVWRMLTDLFLRPVTVHPDLSLSKHFPQRLMAVLTAHLTAETPAYLEPIRFNRAAVTLEGPVRHTPRLMPTRENLMLMGPRA